MARILIIVGGHLCTAPRPQKEAAALASAGHEVTIVGGWFDSEFAAWDRHLARGANYRFIPLSDVRAWHPCGNVRRLLSSIRRRAAQRSFLRHGLISPELFGGFSRAALKYALGCAADLTIVHSEGGLWIATKLHMAGSAVGVDFEDWFSEDLLPADRNGRPVAALRSFETTLLRACRYALTTSRALARELADAAGAPEPAVVYNAFPQPVLDGLRLDRAASSLPTLHWFSQTIGPGRGLEGLFAALPLVTHPCELHLRGRLPQAHRGWLEKAVTPEWRNRIRVHPLVSNLELPSRIAEHDIGLALESGFCPSRDLTITNKFFQYLQGGLAVVATDTRGQREAAAGAGDGVSLVPQNDPPALAAAIDALLAKPGRLASAKAAAFKSQSLSYRWDDQARVIVERAATALKHSPAH